MLDIPTVPAVIVTLLGIFAPYAIAVVNRPEWSVNARKVVAVLASLVIAALALVIYFAATGEPIPQWWVLLLLGLFVTQASYALVTKPTAARLESFTTPTVVGVNSGVADPDTGVSRK